MQKDLNLSNIKYDHKNILAKAQLQIDFDLNQLSKATKTRLLELHDILLKTKKSVEKFENYVGRLANLGIFDYQDLKLHDLFYELDSIVGKEEDAYQWFDSFTDMEFNCFNEQFNFHERAEYLGRTSKFILKSFNIELFFNEVLANDICEYDSELGARGIVEVRDDGQIGDIDTVTLHINNFDYVIYSLFNVDYERLYNATVNEDGQIYLDELDLKDFENIELQQTLDFIIEGLNNLDSKLLIREFKDYIRDDFQIFKYIKRFKDNSIENFREWYEEEMDYRNLEAI